MEDSEDRRTPDRSASYSSVESLATPSAYDSSLFSPSLTPPSDTSYEDAISVLAYGRAGAKPKPFHHPTPYPIPPSRSNAHLFHTFDSPKLYPRQIRRMPPALSDDSRGARSAAEDICTVLRLPGQITHVAALVLDYVVNNYELGLFADARLAGAAAVMLAMGMQGWHAGAEKTKRAMGCRDEALLSLCRCVVISVVARPNSAMCSLWQRHEIAMMRYIYETGSQFSPRST